MSAVRVGANDACCCCQWRCQNLPDESRQEPFRTGSVRVLKDEETNMWRCQLILKVQPLQPSHNFPLNGNISSSELRGDNLTVRLRDGSIIRINLVKPSTLSDLKTVHNLLLVAKNASASTGDSRRGPMKERVSVSSWSPTDVERQLCTSPASDLLEIDPVAAVSSSKSPGSPSLLASSSPSPAFRGCRLQLLEDYEANHSQLPTQSQQNDLSMFESPPPAKMTSSDTNGVRTPTSQTKSKLSFLDSGNQKSSDTLRAATFYSSSQKNQYLATTPTPNRTPVRPVKRGPALLQLDEQQQQTINKRRLMSSFNKTNTLSNYVHRPLNTITSLRGYFHKHLTSRR